MPRPPLGSETMTEFVKFRLSEHEMAILRQLARGGTLSETLRGLINARAGDVKEEG